MKYLSKKFMVSYKFSLGISLLPLLTKGRWSIQRRLNVMDVRWTLKQRCVLTGTGNKKKVKLRAREFFAWMVGWLVEGQQQIYRPR